MSAADSLTRGVGGLAGVGERMELRLARLHIYTLLDLLLHFPCRYEDRSTASRLLQARPGSRGLFEGRVVGQALKGRKRNMLIVTIEDGEGCHLHLRFFHYTSRMAHAFQRGRMVRCYGQIKYASQGVEMVHPDITWPDQGDRFLPYLTAFYPSTEGIQQFFWRKIITLALEAICRMSDECDPLLPDHPSFYHSVKTIHQPPPREDVRLLLNAQSRYHQRIIVEELCAHRLCLRGLRRQGDALKAIPLSDQAVAEQFIASLPFTLTTAQRRCLEEIMGDIAQEKAMFRLLQGDVGSGKTVVAAAVMVVAASCGFQAALMAPTELLAHQHYVTISSWLTPFGVTVAKLRRGDSRKKQRLDKMLATDIVVGTHVLFQDKVKMPRLALVVIDEQHRFGVEQRFLLSQKASGGRGIHHLMMSATPIPRSLAMTSYGDLALSSIDELPAGRLPVQTSVISLVKYADLCAAVVAQCRQMKQAYWICPLIERSEQIAAQAAEERFAELCQSFPDLKVGLVHGRLSEKEKKAIMDDFASNSIQLLVATTVVEVGMDVPNASIMVIENAERLGAAQIHQLRGRVGRGAIQSQCILLYQDPLSQSARSRLEALRNIFNGFDLAEHDLRLRGSGELLGKRQTGLLAFQVADICRDGYLLPEVEKLTRALQQSDPRLESTVVGKWYPKKKEYVYV